jgi:hypothetical protein
MKNGDVCVVTVIADGVVSESFVFIASRSTNGHTTISANAEHKFAELVRKNDSVVASDEMETYLDDGYYQEGSYSVCITWPNVG